MAEGPLGLARGHVHKEGVLTGVGRLDQGLEGRMRQTPEGGGEEGGVRSRGGVVISPQTFMLTFFHL